MALFVQFEFSLIASNHVNKNDEVLIGVYTIVTELQMKEEFTVPGDSEKSSSNVWQSHYEGLSK